MKWTGHSDYKAMKPYIDIAEKTNADAIKLTESDKGGGQGESGTVGFLLEFGKVYR